MNRDKILEQLAAIEGCQYHLESNTYRRYEEDGSFVICNPWRYSSQIAELQKKYFITTEAPDPHIPDDVWFSSCPGNHHKSKGKTLEDAVVLAVVELMAYQASSVTLTAPGSYYLN